MSNFIREIKTGILTEDTLTAIDRRSIYRTSDTGLDHIGRFSIFENTVNKVSFNVMPDRPVTEDLIVKEYRIRPRYIEAIFDRKYFSSMEKSPSHLIFLTALVHTQKMLYTYFCHEFGIEYNPYEKEKLKIWPTLVGVKMPAMITNEKDISHKLWITNLTQKSKNKYEFELHSKIGKAITIDTTALLIRI